MPWQKYINQIIQDELTTNFPPPDQDMVDAEHPAVEHGMTEAFPANNINKIPPISPLPVLTPAPFKQNLNLAYIHAQFNPEGCCILHGADILLPIINVRIQHWSFISMRSCPLFFALSSVMNSKMRIILLIMLSFMTDGTLEGWLFPSVLQNTAEE